MIHFLTRLDFHSFQNENVIAWLKDKTVRGYSVGGAYFPPDRFRSYSLLDSFDGLIFINDTHEVTLDLK
jgi:hypothetical protein